MRLVIKVKNRRQMAPKLFLIAYIIYWQQELATIYESKKKSLNIFTNFLKID